MKRRGSMTTVKMTGDNDDGPTPVVMPGQACRRDRAGPGREAWRYPSQLPNLDERVERGPVGLPPGPVAWMVLSRSVSLGPAKKRRWVEHLVSPMARPSTSLAFSGCWVAGIAREGMVDTCDRVCWLVVSDGRRGVD